VTNRNEAGLDAAGEVALAFLQDFWRGDVAAAVRRCTPGATFVFARSLPYPRECPIGEALTSIVDGLFAQFDPPGQFRVDVRHVVSDGNNVTVEYSARGRLQNGREYENDYVMAITVEDGAVACQRAYTDTLHLSRLFGP
jgi:ketosteroid isomerase-like protein